MSLYSDNNSKTKNSPSHCNKQPTRPPSPLKSWKPPCSRCFNFLPIITTFPPFLSPLQVLQLQSHHQLRQQQLQHHQQQQQLPPPWSIPPLYQKIQPPSSNYGTSGRSLAATAQTLCPLKSWTELWVRNGVPLVKVIDEKLWNCHCEHFT